MLPLLKKRDEQTVTQQLPQQIIVSFVGNFNQVYFINWNYHNLLVKIASQFTFTSCQNTFTTSCNEIIKLEPPNQLMDLILLPFN